MGVDYGTRVVFGWEVNFDTVMTWAIKNKISVGLCDCDRDDEDDDNENWLITPDCTPRCVNFQYERDNLLFEFDYASPYFDCQLSKCVWCFGVVLNDSITITKMKELANITNLDWYNELKFVVHDFGINGDPEIITYHNVY